MYKNKNGIKVQAVSTDCDSGNKMDECLKKKTDYQGCNFNYG